MNWKFPQLAVSAKESGLNSRKKWQARILGQNQGEVVDEKT
jgi:hypothetical protein